MEFCHLYNSNTIEYCDFLIHAGMISQTFIAYCLLASLKKKKLKKSLTWTAFKTTWI